MTGSRSRSFRAFVLLTDAYGAVGGIQTYNRDLLAALCSHPDCTEVVAVPRKMTYSPGALPPRLTYRTDGIGGLLRYCRSVTSAMVSGRFDLLICGHLNLLPLAAPVAGLCRLPLLLTLFGKEAWQPPPFLTRALVGQVDAIASISRITDERFRTWAKVRPGETTLLPNGIHLEQYRPGPKDPALLRQFGLEGKRVLMTFGRLESRERQKGFDEVLGLLPDLVGEYPDLVYLIAGAGPDRPRLEREAADRGMAERVIFTGMVPEEEKGAYYRLADVYLMPSRKEGFGFVFLEAMACGIPVIASRADGGREAVRDGLLGRVVDPDDPEQLRQAVREAFQLPRGVIPAGLDHFSSENFTRRVHDLIDDVRLMQRG